MNTIPAIAAALILILTVACGSSEFPAPGGPVPADAVLLDVEIGPELIDCVGLAPMECLVVDGELFYGSIEGFQHEAGFTYRLRIEQYDRWPELEEPPQDAPSRYGYRLVEVLSKRETP